jgi:ketosteroid isomerase-like protein
MRRADDEMARTEVTALIRSFFEVGKNKEIDSLMGFHSPASLFTKFDENPPYARQNSEEAFILEQAAFASISDYEYKIEDLRIDLVGDVAIATFYLTFMGVVVNSYSFEGTTVGSKSRVTMVVAKFGDGWKIAHAHLSPFPDISKSERQRRQ